MSWRATKPGRPSAGAATAGSAGGCRPVAFVDLFLKPGGAAVLQHLFEQADHGLVTPGAGHHVEPDLEEHPQGLGEAGRVIGPLQVPDGLADGRDGLQQGPLFLRAEDEAWRVPSTAGCG